MVSVVPVAPADAASLLADDPEWAAPPVLLSELRNVMVGLLRRAEIQPWDALDICEDAEAVLGDRVAAVPPGPVLDAAVEGSMSAYDAEFVVLARRLGVPLVSADQYATACPDTGTDAWNWTIFQPPFLFSRTPLNHAVTSTRSCPEVTSKSIIWENQATSPDSWTFTT